MSEQVTVAAQVDWILLPVLPEHQVETIAEIVAAALARLDHDTRRQVLRFEVGKILEGTV